MTEEEAMKEVEALMEHLKFSSGPRTSADYAEIKKWMRIARIFPKGVHKFLPKFKKFHDRYAVIILSMDEELRGKLFTEVTQEYEVEPINDKDFEFVAKGVIETISKKKEI